MNGYATMFISYLKIGKIPYEVKQIGDCSVISVSKDIVEIDESSCKFTRPIQDVSVSKYTETLERINQLNQKYSYVNFYIMSGEPRILCASCKIYLYGKEKEAFDQMLKMYSLFWKSIDDATRK